MRDGYDSATSKFLIDNAVSNLCRIRIKTIPSANWISYSILLNAMIDLPAGYLIQNHNFPRP